MSQASTGPDASGDARELRASHVTAGYAVARMHRSQWRGWIDSPSRPGSAVVLEDVSLSVPAGTVLGLTGPSGAGKTTLARVLTGLLAPETGTVTADGVPVRARRGRMSGDVQMLFQSPRRSVDPHHTLRSIIAEPLLYRATRSRLAPPPAVVSRSLTDGRASSPDADDAVQFVWSSTPRERPHSDEVDQLSAGEAVQLACERVELTPDLLDRTPGEVSLGQLQRASLARVLVARPRYLVCDEATAMLDATTTALVVDVINTEAARGMGVLAISHDAELLAAWADVSVDLADLTSPV